MNEDPVTLEVFFDAWELFRAPALAGAIAGGVLGFLGVYIVLRRMVFLSAALSQAAGLGVALSFYAQIQLGLTGFFVSPSVGAATTTLATTALLMGDRAGKGSRRDSLLGLAWLIGAAGTLAVGTRIVQEVQDIQSILFGSAVVVLDEDFAHIVEMAVPMVLLHVWWKRGFIQASFDPDGARVRGLPVTLIEIVLLTTMALAISLCTRVMGALPVFAFSVLPAMAALRVSANVDRALLVAGAIGAASGFGGYLMAFRFQLPVGASQALVAAGFVLLTSARNTEWTTSARSAASSRRSP